MSNDGASIMSHSFPESCVRCKTAMSLVRKTLRSLRKKAGSRLGFSVIRTARSSRYDENEWIGNDQFGWYRGSQLSSHVLGRRLFLFAFV